VTTEPDRRDALACTGDGTATPATLAQVHGQDGPGGLAGADIFLRMRRKRVVRMPASLRHGRHRAPVGRRSVASVDLPEPVPVAGEFENSGLDEGRAPDAEVAV
jgi:hypothetical protein